MNSKKIIVTQPHLPSLDQFIPYLEKIWKCKILTNGGPLHQELEQALSEYLNVKHLSLFSNGTIALITALQALLITGEVITTPYSFIATAHALIWNRIDPVFVDIDPDTLNLDPKKIEAAITPRTTAILPVHCYGNPCDVDAIGAIASKHRLKVIYDAAHAFGVNVNHSSLLEYGDLSILSFHATKVFNTFEGGAIISPDAQTKQHIDYLKNFGFQDETTVVAFGINGKMNEISAAMGLLQLTEINTVLQKRKVIDTYYRQKLNNIKGIGFLKHKDGSTSNYSYFPIFVQPDFPLTRDELFQVFIDQNIYARRYFYPLISDFEIYKEKCLNKTAHFPIAQRISNQVICLPIYPDLTRKQLNSIIKIIMEKSTK